MHLLFIEFKRDNTTKLIEQENKRHQQVTIVSCVQSILQERIRKMTNQ
jgi:hypothetical protein